MSEFREEAMREPNIGTVPPPGYFIREELEERGWSQRDLAYILDCPEQAVNMIIQASAASVRKWRKRSGKRLMFQQSSLQTCRMLMTLPRRRDPDPGVKRRARLQDGYPVREMIKRGWLQDTDATLLEIQMARFFEVSDPEAIPHIKHAAKKTVTEQAPAPQLAWLYPSSADRQVHIDGGRLL